MVISHAKAYAGRMVFVLKLQLRPGKVFSACGVWKLCLGERGLICGTDRLSPKMSWFYLEAEFGKGRVFYFYLP